MSRIRRFQLEPGRRKQAFLALLLIYNIVLLVAAIARGGAAVTDGSGQITNGWLVAGGIVLTFFVAAGLWLLPFESRIILQAQTLLLGAQALHASGHLLELYYVISFYDDLLHFGLVFGAGLLIYDFTRSRNFLFTRRGGPFRVGVLIWFLATAIAGLWEIFEFVTDVVLGTREQDNLVDTMVDMIDGTLGGALAGYLAARNIRAEKRSKLLAQPHSDELLD